MQHLLRYAKFVLSYKCNPLIAYLEFQGDGTKLTNDVLV